RVSADRSYDNFAQTQDERTGQLRWRLRAGGGWSSELEARTRRQQATQQLFAGSSYARTLSEQGGSAQAIFEPGTGLPAPAVVDASWSRPEGADAATRTIRIGPDLTTPIGARGRGDVSIRRALISGPPAVGLLPSADPAGAPQWEANLRADVRVRESTT